MQTIYIDTSVYGGVFDSEFEKWSIKFFEKLTVSNLTILVSNVVMDELVGAPKEVKLFFSTIPDTKKTTIFLDEEAISLAESYLHEKVVGATSRADCYHIAMATIQKADLLVSWNFKHIVNVPRINGYNAVNLKLGYMQLEIRSPREVFEYGN